MRKCIGGVPLSVDRNESPLSLYADEACAWAAAATSWGSNWLAFGESRARSREDGAPGPGLSRSMPCLLKKCTRNDFIVPAL